MNDRIDEARVLSRSRAVRLAPILVAVTVTLSLLYAVQYHLEAPVLGFDLLGDGLRDALDRRL